jgi:8-oxo-dGTP diphosphatase
MKPYHKTINIRTTIATIINSITPFDTIEHQHIDETLKWINSGADIFRIKKPDTPPKHLVSYFVLYDKKQKKVLLVDHKNACLWLPSGGHVEIDEHPSVTVERECIEELGINADFWHPDPFFITTTITVGLTAGHTDVSLWYILNGNAETDLAFDKGEFNTVAWFDFNDIPFERSDPHMRRFIQKLQEAL